MLVIFGLWILFQEVTSSDLCDAPFVPPVLTNRSIFRPERHFEKTIQNSENTGCICTEVPEKYSVCYGLNKEDAMCATFPKDITISTDAFRLKSAHIQKISYGDLLKFSHLRTLEFNGNEKLTLIESRSFENLTNLTSLSLISNPLLTHLEVETFLGLVKLKYLNLAKNGFHRINELSLALTPMILPKLISLNLSGNRFKNVTENDFESMNGSRLEELKLSSCGILGIHPKSLKYLKNLKKIYLGQNRFNSKTLLDLLNQTIDFGVNLEELDLYFFGFEHAPPVSLLKLIAQTNITTLNLSKNHFETLNNSTFPIFMPNLISLDLSDVSAHTIDRDAFSNLPNLNSLVLSDNQLSYFPAKNLPNLTYLDLRGNVNEYGLEFALRKSEFSKMKLQYLDIEDMRIYDIIKADFGNMSCLRILNLKNCSIRRIETKAFEHLSNLEFLKLERNNFFRYWLEESFEMFGGLQNLEILLLGENDITTLTTPKGHLLKHLHKLYYLDLQKNSLQTISKNDFATLPYLKVLRINENKLQAWDGRVFLNNKLNIFHGSVNRIAYISDAMLQDFKNLTKVELSFNAFICDCSIRNNIGTNLTAVRKFLSLIQDEIHCVKPQNKTLQNFLQNLQNLYTDCDIRQSFFVFLVPSSIFLALLIVASVLGYIYRWHIRYWAFLTKIHLTRRGDVKIQNTNNAEYVFDAFVSYCNQDQDFVVTLVRMLEDQAPYLKLCIYERDFQVGSVISESIIEYIAKSRKTLLLVSNSYAKSYWCSWETQIAEHHRLFEKNTKGDYINQSIVLIKLGTINQTSLTPTLNFLLKTRIHLQWDTDEEKQRVFWLKLRQFLTPPQNNLIQTSYI